MTHVGRLPDAGRVEHPLLTLRGRMARGAGARVPTAKVRHLDRSPVPAPSLLVVARLSRHAAPAVAEEAREPLAQQRTQGRQAGGHDRQACLDRVEGRAPRDCEEVFLGLVEGVGVHADSDDSDCCDSGVLGQLWTSG